MQTQGLEQNLHACLSLCSFCFLAALIHFQSISYILSFSCFLWSGRGKRRWMKSSAGPSKKKEERGVGWSRCLLISSQEEVQHRLLGEASGWLCWACVEGRRGARCRCCGRVWCVPALQGAHVCAVWPEPRGFAELRSRGFRDVGKFGGLLLGQEHVLFLLHKMTAWY